MKRKRSPGRIRAGGELKPDVERRSGRMEIRLTPSEKEAFEKEASRRGFLTVSAWARSALIQRRRRANDDRGIRLPKRPRGGAHRGGVRLPLRPLRRGRFAEWHNRPLRGGLPQNPQCPGIAGGFRHPHIAGTHRGLKSSCPSVPFR